MTRLTLLMPLIVCLSGCSKPAPSSGGEPAPTAENAKPRVVPSGSGDLSGGSGGAVQDVRKAAARTVNDRNLDQLSKFIQIAMAEDAGNKVPSADEIKESVKNDAAISTMLREGVVILSDTRDREGVWAYTKWPQRAGKHYVIVAAGRADMTPAELTEALKKQGSPVKIEK